MALPEDPDCPKCGSEDSDWQGATINNEDGRTIAESYRCGSSDCREGFLYNHEKGEAISQDEWTRLKNIAEDDDNDLELVSP